MSKVKIGVVGLGDIACKAYLPIIAHHPEIELVLCTRNTALLSSLSEQYRISETTSEFDNLLSQQPDAIMIHAATAAHFDLALASLSVGIPTFIDKPICNNAIDAVKLVELAKKTQTPFFCGFNRRYLPALTKLDLEKVNCVEWSKHRHNQPGESRSFVFDDFIHVIDSLLNIAQVKTREDLQRLDVFATYHEDFVSLVSLSFVHNGKLYQGKMDRCHGINKEVVELHAHNTSFHINALSELTLLKDNQHIQTESNQWQSHLFHRGFEEMLEQWVEMVLYQGFDEELLNSYTLTHQVCEEVLAQIA